jgi:hypothetical protein
MELQVRGAGDQNVAHVADLDGSERAVGEVSDSDRDIDAFLNELDGPIDERQSDGQAGVTVQELGDNRDDVQAAEGDGRGDDELPLRLGQGTADSVLSRP